ncbi:helix-turn-helix domain-containing protein [Streptomyces sp. URMC 123]|uniref:helix-turn-helix domain-containing protein n=1 Tax=Streptomyces sp. URMC 123 TaxID=3423403 RepID=UPI003F1B223E
MTAVLPPERLPAATGVGPLLRVWRERRRLSQLDLALLADSSARHISFIETGRSRPSAELLLKLAERLEVPMRERNALLLAAGHAPHYPQTPVDDPAMAGLRGCLDRLLTGYEPFPALVVDGVYDVLAANRGVAMLLEGVAGHLLEPPVNAMRITLHPEGLAPRIRNLRAWRGELLAQMERQIALVRSPRLRELYEEVSGYPVAPCARPDLADAGPDLAGAEAAGSEAAEGRPPFALPMRIEREGRVLSFLSTITTFNTPMDVTVSELAIETFVPADPETARYLRDR